MGKIEINIKLLRYRQHGQIKMKAIINEWTIVLNGCGVVTVDNGEIVDYPVMKNGRIIYRDSNSIPKHIKKEVIKFFTDNLDLIHGR